MRLALCGQRQESTASVSPIARRSLLTGNVSHAVEATSQGARLEAHVTHLSPPLFGLSAGAGNRTRTAFGATGF
jgi:hypothetical protein